MGGQYTAADIFQGAGGGSIALSQTHYKVVAAVDIDPIACETYQKNLHLEPICGDLSRISGREILAHYGLGKGDISCIVGCPPCQGFSSLRRTRYPNQEDERKSLVNVFIDRIREIDPKSVIFENVSGILWGKNRLYFDKYLAEMEGMGYKTSWDVFNAADFGVPQIRKRVVAISVKGMNGKPPLPTKTHVKPSMENSDQISWLTVRDAIEDLPHLEPGEAHPDILNHAAREHTKRIRKMISLIPKDGGSRKSLPEDYWLKCHKNLKKRKGAENIYGRLWWDKPAGTITCRCTTPSSGRFLHPEQDRAITPREAARLQTFPDDFKFPDVFYYAEKQIGNAVPVDFMRAVLETPKEFL